MKVFSVESPWPRLRNNWRHFTIMIMIMKLVIMKFSVDGQSCAKFKFEHHKMPLGNRISVKLHVIIRSARLEKC